MLMPLRDTSNVVHMHSRYYYSNGNLTIRVSNVLFRILDEPFRSNFNAFVDRYSLPETPAFGECIGTDEDPIIIDDVKSWEFDRFLGVLFPPFQPGSTSFFSDYGLNEWLIVLKLATMWGFSSVKEFALERISSMKLDHLNIAVIGDRYSVSLNWWFDALVHLVKRAEPISIDEARYLGESLTVCIFTAREILGEEGRRRAEDVAYVVAEIFNTMFYDKHE